MLNIRLVDRDHYIQFIEKHPLRNFLQYPSWSDLKTQWRWSSEFVGWFNGDKEMVGGANILYRKVPGLNKFLAYIPRGPLIDWFSSRDLREWFQPLFRHLRQAHAFSVKIDPPLVRRKWGSESIVYHLEQFRQHQLKNKKMTDILPDENSNEVEFFQQELQEIGWRQKIVKDSFDTVQPQYIYRLPMKGKSLQQIYDDLHPLWQEKIVQAEKQGIVIEMGTEEDLPKYHQLMSAQVKREQVQVREINYFLKMFETLTFEDPHRIKLYLAKQGGKLLCGALAIRVEGHTWDIYGVSSEGKLVDLSNVLMRWQMIQDAHQSGDHIYDFRGISTTLDEFNPYFDLLKFRIGFGGEVCELMGEWDYPVIPMLHWAFDMYMKRR